MEFIEREAFTRFRAHGKFLGQERVSVLVFIPVALSVSAEAASVLGAAIVVAELLRHINTFIESIERWVVLLFHFLHMVFVSQSTFFV